MTEFNFHEFTDAISSMTELLDQEAELLATMQIRKVGDMQEKKVELTTRLEQQQNFLNNNPLSFKSLSNQQVDQLRQYSARFNNSMRTYSDELFKASQVNERVVTMIIDTVKEQVRSKNTYQNFGLKKAREQAEYMPAIKFNEQI
jgi:hypothetical protein